MKISAAFIAAALAIGQVDAFWRMGCRGHGYVKRLDPIVNPNGIAGHAHFIHGPNTFSADPDANTLVNSDCTSCEVKQDRSGYWEPQLYFQSNDDKSFTPVESDGMIVYYLLRSEKGPNDPNIKAFPPGFRMLAGNMLARRRKHNGGNSQEAHAEKAVGYVCTDAAGGGGATYGIPEFPQQKALNGECNMVRSDIMFPSCWDGKNLDSENHKSHMAYPSTMDDGFCPESHPVRLPSLLFETYWKTHQFRGKNGRFVWSHGDATGRGFHADFMNGWEQDVLEEAVKTCRNMSGNVWDCPILQIQSTDDSSKCSIKKPDFGIMAAMSTEKVDGKLDKLPGCNPVTGDEVDVAPKPNLCDADGNVIGGSPAPPVVKTTPPAPSSSPATPPSPPAPPAVAIQEVPEAPVPERKPIEANASDDDEEVEIVAPPAPVAEPIPTPARKVVTVVVTSTTTVTCDVTVTAPVARRSEHAHVGRRHVHHRRQFKA